MLRVNPANVLNMLMVLFQISNIPQTPTNDKEIELHNTIKNIIQNSMDDMSFAMQTDTTLEFENYWDLYEAEFVAADEIEEVEELDEDEGEDSCTSEEYEIVNNNYKRRAVEFWKSGKKGRYSLSSVQHRFKKVKSLPQLYKWELSLQRGGTHREKLLYISEYVLNKFKDANDKNSIMHDIDLRRWALEAKEEINLPHFKAGATWILNFKRKHGIVSRKITKFVNHSSKKNQEQLQIACQDFIGSVKSFIDVFDVQNIYNADESGFNLEVHSGRTLTTQGVKTVESVVQSLSAMTHSYTIMPTISASGQLQSPLYLVLKEASGSFGPRVEATLFRPANIFIAASKSGKLTTQHFQSWFTNVFLPATGSFSVLLLDSWSGHCPANLQEFMPSKDKDVRILTIPKKTTAMIQPLDVYGFRVWKNFVRTFSDRVTLLNYDINLHLRNNIIKLQSLTHIQLSSPRFHNLFKYVWFKSGYIDVRPPQFENPVDFCFSGKDIQEIPRCSICDAPAIIRCSWCKKYFCMHHFFEEYHDCKYYEI
ncbi:uncharacterized protein [Temnothorax nylanderi]|uniref:uncharacterized protein n=1 Tax=Temnothorax nylanderi TaxID=102681 RepID=UPI003A8BFE23